MSKFELFRKRNVHDILKDLAYLSIESPKGKILDHYIFGIIDDPYLQGRSAYVTFPEHGWPSAIIVNYMGKTFEEHSTGIRDRDYSQEFLRAHTNYVHFINRQTEQFYDLHRSITPNQPPANHIPPSVQVANMEIPGFLSIDNETFMKDIKRVYVGEKTGKKRNDKYDLYLSPKNSKRIVLWAVVSWCVFLTTFQFSDILKNLTLAWISALCAPGMSLPLFLGIIYVDDWLNFHSGEFVQYSSDCLENYHKITQRLLPDIRQNKIDNEKGESDRLIPPEKLLKDEMFDDLESVQAQMFAPLRQDSGYLLAERVRCELLGEDKIAVDLFMPGIKHLPRHQASLGNNSTSRFKLDKFELHENYAYYVHSAALCAADYFFKKLSACKNIMLSVFINAYREEETRRLYEVEFDRDGFYLLDFKNLDALRAFDDFPHQRKLTHDYRFEPI